MKLVEIKDIQINQVYRNKNTSFYNYSIITKINKQTIKVINIQEEKREYLISKLHFLFFNKLIGFINITHKLKNNNLIEIPREEFEVDRIIRVKKECIKKGQIFYIKKISKEYNDKIMLETLDINGKNVDFYNSIKNMRKVFEEIGDLDVNYKLINDKLEE